MAEVIDTEHSFCVGKIEALQVGVESGFWGPKIWDSGRGRNSSTSHDNDVLSFSLFDVLCDGIKGTRAEGERRGIWIDLGVLLAHFTTFAVERLAFALLVALVARFVFATYGEDLKSKLGKKRWSRKLLLLGLEKECVKSRGEAVEFVVEVIGRRGTPYGVLCVNGKLQFDFVQKVKIGRHPEQVSP